MGMNRSNLCEWSTNVRLESENPGRESSKVSPGRAYHVFGSGAVSRELTNVRFGSEIPAHGELDDGFGEAPKPAGEGACATQRGSPQF
jgi:hypothetical protein